MTVQHEANWLDDLKLNTGNIQKKCSPTFDSQQTNENGQSLGEISLQGRNTGRNCMRQGKERCFEELAVMEQCPSAMCVYPIKQLILCSSRKVPEFLSVCALMQQHLYLHLAMFSSIKMQQQLFMLSVTSWLDYAPWVESPQSSGNASSYRVLQHVPLATPAATSALREACFLLSTMGSLSLWSYTDLRFEDILLVWIHSAVYYFCRWETQTRHLIYLSPNSGQQLKNKCWCQGNLCSPFRFERA